MTIPADPEAVIPDPDLDDDPNIAIGSPALPWSGPEAVTFLAVLGRRDFRLLWLAQVAAQLGDKFLMFTLLIVVYSLTGRASTQSLLMLSYTVPSILLSAFAGVYADRHDKRRLMLSTNVARCGLMLLVPVALATPRLGSNAWPLIVITVAFSSAGQFFAPAEAASIPMLVRRDQILLATSLFMTTVVVTLVAGVPAATLALKLLGRTAPFYIAAALFAFAAVSVVLMRTPLRAGRQRVRAHPGVVRELREGVRLLHGTPVLRTGLAQLTVSLVTVFTMFALGPAFTTRVLDLRAEDTYQLLMPSTLGLVGAAVVLGRRGARISRATAAWTAAAGSGVLLIITGIVPGELVHHHAGLAITGFVIVASAGFGASIGTNLIVAFTVLQEGADEATRGRIFGGIFTVINAATAIPLLVAGQLADSIGVDHTVVLLGVGMLGWGIGCRVLLRSRLQLLDAVGSRPRR